MERPTASSPPLSVLTDADLLKRITSFAIGIPWPLYEFWLQHKDGAGFESVIDAFRASHPVVRTIVEHGTPQLLALAARVRLPGDAESPFSPFGSLNHTTLDLYAVVHFAITAHQPEALEWGLQYERDEMRPGQQIYEMAPHRETWTSVLHECRDGDTRMLDVLKRHTPADSNVLQEVFTQRFIERNVTTVAQLRWIITALPELHLERGLLSWAAQRGDLEMVTFLHERGSCGRLDANTFPHLYHQCHWKVLAFLLDHDLADVRDDLAETMVEEQDKFIQQLVRKHAPRFQTGFQGLVHDCIKRRDIVQLRSLLQSKHFKTDFPVSIDRAAAGGSLEVIQLLHELGIATATTEAMDSAAENEAWDVVKFLHESRTEGCTARALDAAIDQCDLGHVKYLVENRPEGCSSRGMVEAAKNRDMRILRYLHECAQSTCTTEAMDAAAAEGHLHVVQFLHQHRTEGCTVNAMNGASANGHLDMVRFLHEHRSEGCTIEAVRGALRARKPLVITFLRNHYPHFFDRELLHDALLYGAFDLFLDLQREFPEEADAVVGDVAFEAGRQLELPTIHFIITVLERTDVGYRAMDGAARMERCGQGQWLRAVFAITGSQSCRLSAVQTLADNLRERTGRSTLLEAITFVVDACCEPGARTLVLEAAQTSQKTAVIEALVDGTSTPRQLRPLHPFLLDVRTPSWAIAAAFDCMPLWNDPYWRDRGQFTWAQRAVYADDMTMLEVLRDIPACARPRHNCHGDELHPDEIDHHFSFYGARAAATRTGNLLMLQWLLEHVDLPVEPTLLTEAVYYHKFDIALWLLGHHPEACKETNWAEMRYVPWVSSCDFDDGLLEWLETHDTVRTALDFGAIIDAAADWDDVEPLRSLHARYPELVMARPSLLELAIKREGPRDVDGIVSFLVEIGYSDQDPTVVSLDGQGTLVECDSVHGSFSFGSALT